jgi:hypothetical protein
MFSTFRNTTLAAIVAVMSAAAFPAKATLITYTFSADASMIFTETLGSDVIHLSGQFTIDTTESHLPAVSITAKCSGSNCPRPLIESPAVFDVAQIDFAFPTSIDIPFSSTDDVAAFAFASSLIKPGTIDLVTSSSVNGGNPSSVLGDVTTPEPSSLPLLISALARRGAAAAGLKRDQNTVCMLVGLPI